MVRVPTNVIGGCLRLPHAGVMRISRDRSRARRGPGYCPGTEPGESASCPDTPGPNQPRRGRSLDPRDDLLDIRVARESKADRLTVAGEVDMRTADELQMALARLGRGRSAPIVLDLAGVTFADSQLVHILERAARVVGDRKLTVVGAQPQVARVLALWQSGQLRARGLG